MRQAGAQKLREGDQPLDAARERPLRLVEPAAERRTIVISGRPDPAPRRRSSAQAHIAARPDRVALWAFLLGLFLVFVAAATAHAAPLA